MSKNMAPSSRPLSPHLSIYRFTLTMAMSILQRATGIAQYLGLVLFVLWLVAAALGGGALDFANALFASWFGQIVLFGYSWSLLHHMLGGLRYFTWDRAKAMDKVGRETLVRIQLGGSIVLTLAGWAIFVWFK